jgi:hypothetical protein
MRAFENSVLRIMSGTKRGDVNGGWRKLHNDELRKLYSSNSNNYAKEDEMDRTCSRVEEKRTVYRLLVEKTEGERN